VHQRTCSVASAPASSSVAAEPSPDTGCDVVGRDGRPMAYRRRRQRSLDKSEMLEEPLMREDQEAGRRRRRFWG